MGMPSPQRSSRVVISEINVTPFVDVMLVLLIIFMVTAPMMQQGLEVQLPETENSGVSTKEEPFILIITKDKRLKAGSADLSINNLKTKLKAIFASRKNKQIYLQADKRVEYGFVAEVMAEVRGAGLYNIGLITIPKVGQ